MFGSRKRRLLRERYAQDSQENDDRLAAIGEAIDHPGGADRPADADGSGDGDDAAQGRRRPLKADKPRT